MARLRDLQPGASLGRYELVLRVAQGGMGEIWAARLKGTRGFQKVVALKTLLPELSHNPSFEKMFLAEAELAAKIRHPNVVQVIDLGEDGDVLYQVMEWVSGESLWTLMRAAAKKDGIPLVVAARIVTQVCGGLHAAHELRGDDGKPIGLVHRDVSPQNVLVTADGVAKVVDFGVAKYAGRGVAETKAGEVKGKVPYMAPEHVLGRQLDRRADVFALGILFYQMVSGTHPFLQDDDRLTMARISSGVPVAPLKSKVPSISAKLSQVVGSALAKSPSARTATAADFMRALEEAVPECAVQSSNELVAAYLREVVGENVELRSLELREALKRLDGEEKSEPALAVAPIKAAAVIDLSRDDGPGEDVPPRVETKRWPPPPSKKPPDARAHEAEPDTSGSGITSVSENVEDSVPPPPMGSSERTWIGRHRVAAVLTTAAVAAGIAFALGVGRGTSEAPAPAAGEAAVATPAPPVPASAPIADAPAATATATASAAPTDAPVEAAAAPEEPKPVTGRGRRPRAPVKKGTRATGKPPSGNPEYHPGGI